jgi:probable DNA metabolism protein
MTRVVLQGPADVAGFRRAARALLAAGEHPDHVNWSTGEAPDDLWGAAELASADPQNHEGHEGHEDQEGQEGPGGQERQEPHALDDREPPAEGPCPASAPRLSVPASFVRLCDTTLLHSDPQRFALMYRLLWRLKAMPSFWQDMLDPERRRAEQMAREVRRAIHKMHAFVRFFPVEDQQGEQYLAWFEPDHFVEEAASPFFARRFANMRWAILTPRCSISWDGQALQRGPAGRREDVPPMDAGAGLWLTYYRSIFNPARLKVAMMEKEMPRRYWANLPEAALIEPLIAQAQGRLKDMLTSEATPPRKIRPMPPIPRDGRDPPDA